MSADGPSVTGIDLSHWQQTTPSLADIGFVIARASIGTKTDEMYDKHIAAAKRAGKVTGAYHFNWDTVSVAAQVKTFLDKAGDVDLFVIDVEGANAFNETQGREFIRRVKATGRKIGMYHSDSGFPYWGQDWHWVANWSREPARAYQIWQFGIFRGVDGNRFQGSLAQLRTFAGVNDVTPAPITNEVPRIVTTSTGHTWWDLDGTTVLFSGRPALPERLSPYGVGSKRAIFATVGGVRRTVLIVPATNDPLPTPEDTTPFDQAYVEQALADLQADLSEANETIAGEALRLQAAIDADRQKARIGVVFD